MKEITNKDNFNDLISTGVSLVDFYTTWCGPCRALTPIIVDISKEFDDKMNFFKVNLDDNDSIMTQFNIITVPTVLIFKDGVVVETILGLSPKKVFLEKLTAYI